MWKKLALWIVKQLASAAAKELVKKAQAKQIEAMTALQDIERLKVIALRATAEAEAFERDQLPAVKALLAAYQPEQKV